MSDAPADGVPPNDANDNNEPEVLSVDDLMGGDSPTMPEVQAHTVEAARASSAKAAEPALQSAVGGTPVKGQTDDLGRTFNSSIHESMPDGKPKMNKAGFIAKRRGGAAKAGGVNASKVNTKAKDAPAAAVPENLEASIQQTAAVSTALFLTMAQMAGGEEFAPVVDSKTGENEPAAIESAFANYYRIKGIIDIPPGIALAVGLSFYVIKRWNAPKFTERREGWTGGIRRWWADFRLRRKMAREARDAMDARATDASDPSKN